MGCNRRCTLYSGGIKRGSNLWQLKKVLLRLDVTFFLVFFFSGLGEALLLVLGYESWLFF